MLKFFRESFSPPLAPEQTNPEPTLAELAEALAERTTMLNSALARLVETQGQLAIAQERLAVIKSLFGGLPDAEDRAIIGAFDKAFLDEFRI